MRVVGKLRRIDLRRVKRKHNRGWLNLVKNRFLVDPQVVIRNDKLAIGKNAITIQALIDPPQSIRRGQYFLKTI